MLLNWSKNILIRLNNSLDLPTYQLSYLHTYPPTILQTYLPTYHPTSLPTYLFNYLSFISNLSFKNLSTFDLPHKTLSTYFLFPTHHPTSLLMYLLNYLLPISDLSF